MKLPVKSRIPQDHRLAEECRQIEDDILAQARISPSWIIRRERRARFTDGEKGRVPCNPSVQFAQACVGGVEGALEFFQEGAELLHARAARAHEALEIRLGLLGREVRRKADEGRLVHGIVPQQPRERSFREPEADVRQRPWLNDRRRCVEAVVTTRLTFDLRYEFNSSIDIFLGEGSVAGGRDKRDFIAVVQGGESEAQSCELLPHDPHERANRNALRRESDSEGALAERRDLEIEQQGVAPLLEFRSLLRPRAGLQVNQLTSLILLEAKLQESDELISRPRNRQSLRVVESHGSTIQCRWSVEVGGRLFRPSNPAVIARRPGVAVSDNR
ncbi:MAG: hypothetical protein NTV97_25980 [Alphaproteobacteria bacterium]|nr:hypothetical protein [Alphaproteobacteria bacterium]